MSLRSVRFQPGGMHMADVRDVRMNWSAIFAGACLTLGFGIFFLLLGNAIGLSVVNTVRTDISGALKFLSWLYMAAAFVFSYFIGSYLSTRSDAVNTPASSIVHGLTIWSLSSAVFVAVASIASIGVRILLAGLASNPANWLVLCIVGLGAIAACAGGIVGKASLQRLRTTPSSEVSDRTRVA
jgi:ABC-type multidrug transport system fused ATPase/permease subunit